MDKKSYLVWIASLILMASTAYSAPVNVGKAAAAAESFLRNLNPQTSIPSLKHAFSTSEMHAFNISTGGFILMAADDDQSPVIGFDFEGNLDGSLVKGDENYPRFIRQVSADLQINQQKGIRSESSALWSSYVSNTVMRERASAGQIEPILRSNWDQGELYNTFCPADVATNKRTYAGCVAVAMSQIMFHHRHPLHGTGVTDYESTEGFTVKADFSATNFKWSEMLGSLTAESDNSIIAVSELLFMAAASVRTNFSLQSSGAYAFRAAEALKNTFGYSPDAVLLTKNRFTPGEWEEMIIKNLNRNEPVFYSGNSTTAGHAFVCDGYMQVDGVAYFHFNFGWSGRGNGYYSLSNLNNYNEYQEMIINIYPDESKKTARQISNRYTKKNGNIYTASGDSVLTDNSYLVRTWQITPEDTVSAISLKILKASLNQLDTLLVFSGPDSTWPVLKRVTFGDTLTRLEVNNDALYIRLVQRQADPGFLFSAEYQSSSPDFCDNGITTLSARTGTITDGSNGHSYTGMQTCRWLINTGSRDASVVLHFTEFETEEDKDFVSIYSMPDYKLIHSLSGSKSNTTYTIPSGQVLIIFKSDPLNHYAGFYGTYTVNIPTAAEQEEIIELAVYPNPASDFLDISFTGRKPGRTTVELFTLGGQRVMQKDLGERSEGSIKERIPLQGLAKGTYLFLLNSAGSRTTRKIVKL